MSGMPLTLFLIVAVVLTALYLRRLKASGVGLIQERGAIPRITGPTAIPFKGPLALPPKGGPPVLPPIGDILSPWGR